MKTKIHIFGASGSGTTSIGKRVSEILDYRHFDTDSFYWYPTEPKFTNSRPIDERLQLMTAELSACDKWVLSGSLDGWGNPLIPLFELMVFVYVPTDIRMERLNKREYERYGKAMLSGGNRYESTQEFLDWAAGYDSGLLTGRSLPRHEQWMSSLECELIRVVNHSLEDSVNAVIEAAK